MTEILDILNTISIKKIKNKEFVEKVRMHNSIDYNIDIIKYGSM